MSLFSGLFQEAAVLDVWMSIRSDGVLGSGTASDPFSGAVERVRPVLITSLTAIGDVATANSGTVPHGLTVGDLIEIFEVTGDAASVWNGYFLWQPRMGTYVFKT